MGKRNQLRGKVVVITGASSGIGEALAKEYASCGAKLVLAARSIEKLNELKESLKTPVLTIQTDVTSEEQCKHLITTAVAHFQAIDVLINNAGISMRAPFEDVEIEVVHRLMNVNFWGAVYCTKYAIPHLQQSKGSLVGVISIAGYVGLPGRIGYSASKYAMRGMLDVVRVENITKGVHVLTAAPGYTASKIRERALVEGGQEQGETPREESKMMSAERVAFLIRRAQVKRKRTLNLTFSGRFIIWLSHVLPALSDKLIYRSVTKTEEGLSAK